MEIDFSVGKPVINELALQLVIILGVPLVGAFILMFILKLIRLPSFVVIPVAIFVMLFGVYQMFMVMF